MLCRVIPHIATSMLLQWVIVTTESSETISESAAEAETETAAAIVVVLLADGAKWLYLPQVERMMCSI